MRLRDVSYGLKAVSDVARAGEELFGTLDRTRSRGRGGALFIGVALGVGIGALIFDTSTRKRVREWLYGKPGEATTTTEEGTTSASTEEKHEEPAPPPATH